jgi:hypothetical protein
MMDEIAIVGGGIAGLYCALHLAKTRKVTLFESLDRLGGRIETVDLQEGFKAECGPMRFELEIEPLFRGLTRSLGLEAKFTDFAAPQSGTAEFPKHDLQAHERSTQHKKAVDGILGPNSHSEVISGMYSHHTPALDVLKFGIYRMFNRGAQEQALSLDAVVAGGKESKITKYADSLKDDYDAIRTTAKLEKVPIYMLGFWNALARVLSPGAIAKIRDLGTFYHLLPENPSASEWAIFWLRMFRSDAKLSTIKDGVGTIVDKLWETLKNEQHLDVQLNSTVENIATGAGGKVGLKIAKDPDVREFDHVILAIPAMPLRQLYENFPRNIKTYIDGVIPFPLLKVFAVIDKPWWEESPLPQQGSHLVPTREIHYFLPTKGAPNRAMIMFYTDRPATAYWHVHIDPPHTKAQLNTAANLKHELALHIARLLPRNDRDENAHIERVEQSLLDFAIRDWSEPPFGAACHAWAPKFNVPAALDQLKAFGLEPDKRNVHVCGEAYSDYQGFIEGALRSAKSVLQEFGINP